MKQHATSLKPLTANQQERRQKILDATRKLVSQLGYEGTVMRDVAQLAGVSPTTLYNLYNTKDELLLAALQNRVTDGWQRASEHAGEPGFDRLMALLEHSVAQTHEEPTYAKVITNALQRTTPGDPLIDMLIYGNIKAITSSLKTMQQRHQIKTKNIPQLATDLIGAFWTQYTLWSKDVIQLDALLPGLQRSFLYILLPYAQAPFEQLLTVRLKKLH